MSRSANLAWHENAGNAVVSSVTTAIVSCVRAVWHRPFSVASTLFLTVGLTLGMGNALWLQHGRHPAPLFIETASVVVPSQQVVQMTPSASIQAKPVAVPKPVAPPATQLASTRTAAGSDEKPGNKEVAELQLKLKLLGLFDGVVDGFYGPMTAQAIRAFEQFAGLKPVGALTPEIVDAVSRYAPPKPAIPAPLPVASHTSTLIEAALPALEPPVLDPTNLPANKQDPVLTIALKAAEPIVVDQLAAAPVAAGDTIIKVQRGLARLGFLTSEISGKLDPGTARAIREFENYINLAATGKITSDLIDLLSEAGAFN